MSEDRFDVIIVGAGPAGTVTGYVCAQAGLEVLIIERGDTPGSKNMSGGRLYGHSLEKIMPGFAAQAPVQRRVARETISMLTPQSSFSLDFQSALLCGEGQDSYTVLRAEFDQWLAAKAEEAGAVLAGNVRVDDLLRHNGRVSGVVAGPDEMAADIVVAADGVNSLLAQKAGLKKELKPGQVSVGVKEVMALPQETINDRFGLKGDEGAARLFVGEATKG
ncbi:MAG: FAD-dependent oxidoreductase, partial [Pseudomonadota bacterium]